MYGNNQDNPISSLVCLKRNRVSTLTTSTTSLFPRVNGIVKCYKCLRQNTFFSCRVLYSTISLFFSVTLRADPGDYFRGFFIQATRANYALDRGDRPAYGTFRPADTNSQPRRCRSAVGKVGGITHTGNNNKTEISFDWEPPRGCNLGDIQFV